VQGAVTIAQARARLVKLRLRKENSAWNRGHPLVSSGAGLSLWWRCSCWVPVPRKRRRCNRRRRRCRPQWFLRSPRLRLLLSRRHRLPQ
jgi:hypothetical protein